VLVGNGQAFWGDSVLGPVGLVEGGPIHYLTLDYLAEVTMSILQKLRSRNPSAGYATDFVSLLGRILPACRDRGIKIVANAGGVNPEACRDACIDVVKSLGIHGLRIGIVSGDDILNQLDDLVEAGEAFDHLETGDHLDTVLPRILSANAYIGARPIADALDLGADIVITGRAADPSLTVGPLMHEFGWLDNDVDKIAAGTVAGHIIECGAQCTGGNHTNWRDVPNLAGIGYPIVDFAADGDFAVTKHPGTGGTVDISTVAEQLLYELGDPKTYISPDVVADFTSVRLRQEAADRVGVSGIRGRLATDTFKVSIAYSDGYKVVSQLTIAGPDAVDKAELCASILFERLAIDGIHLDRDDCLIETLGTNVCHKGIAPAPDEPAEVILRIAARSDNQRHLERLAAEVAPLVASGPPGLTGFASGRSKPSDVVGYWPALVHKSRIKIDVDVKAVQ
jgi:Acyclic terpene utilisation family protein AtuA